MRPRDQRTHFGLSLCAVANDNFSAGLGQAGEEFFGYLALEDQARPRAADLTLSGEDAEHSEFQRRVEIGIGKDNVRALAAEFEGHFLEVAGRGGHDFASGDPTAGEGDLVHPVARREGRTHRVTGPEDEVGRTGRKTGFFHEFEKFHRGNGRHFRRLENARIACGQTRRELPNRHEQRVVPRDDLRADPDRLAHGQANHVRVADAVGLALRLAGQAGVVAETARGIRRIVARLAQRLAVVLGVEPGELFGVFFHQVGQGEQFLRPLGSRALAPGTLIKSLARRSDGILRIGCPAVGRLDNDFVVRGIENVASGPAAGRDPLAVDVVEEGFHESKLSRISAVSTMPR